MNESIGGPGPGVGGQNAETQVLPRGRRVTQVRLEDGREYPFAELPASTALAVRFAGAIKGEGFEQGDLGALHGALRMSLLLGGLGREDAEDALWLVDLHNREVVAALMAAVFPGGAVRGARAVAPGNSGVRAGVGDSAG